MSKNLQDIDKMFRDALDDHLEPAPPGVWDGVSSNLDKKQADSFRQKYVRMKRMALALLLIVFAGTASLLYVGLPANKSASTTGNSKTSEPNGTATVKNNTDAGTAGAAEKAVLNNDANAKKEIDAVTGAEPAAENNTAKDASSTLLNENARAAGNNKNAANNTVAKENTGAAMVPNAAAHDQQAAATREPLATAVATAKNKHTANTKLSARDKQQHNNNGYAAVAAAGNRSQLTMSNENSRSNKNTLTAVNGKQLKQHHNAGLSSMNGLAAANQQDLTNKNDKRTNTSEYNAGESQATARQVTPLGPYLSQPPLLGAVDEIETADLFVPVKSTPLLHELAKNKLAANRAPGMKPLNHHALSLTVFGSPNHSFTRLVNDMQPWGWGRSWGKEAAEREEKQGSSYSGGVLLNYNLNKHLILQSGVVYSSATTNISPKIIYARPDNNGHTRYEFNCSSGYAYISPKTGATPAVGDSIKVMGSNSTISYIGIPLSLNYVWQIGRFAVKPGIGIGVNFLTNGKSATTFGGQGYQKEQTQISGLRKAYLDGSVALGAEYMLSRRIAIGVRPLLRMAVTSINKNTPLGPTRIS